jgi:hypothetical protein
MLREFGCPQVQGFLYGYPGAADADTKPEAGKVTSILRGALKRRLGATISADYWPAPRG